MPVLHLSLLGPPVLERDGAPLELGRRKALALLVYLAMTARSQPREALATLLWPEAASSDSRAALRRVLSDLNKALGENWALANNTSVGIHTATSLELDVSRFRRLLAQAHQHPHPPTQACNDCIPLISQAINLYRGDFLEGFSLPDAPEFDEWQFFECETLRRECSAALQALVEHSHTQTTQGNTISEQAIHCARRWTILEPLNETAQARLMQFYATSGQPAAALRQYRAYAHQIEHELGEPPSKMIRDLYERIRKGQTGAWVGENRDLAERSKIPLAAEAQPTKDGNQITTAEKIVSKPTTPTERATIEYRPEEEIRLATALFVGLSSDTGADWNAHPERVTEAARNLVNIVNRVAHRYAARPEHFVGQGMFVLFGMPVLHEDDAERALRAALEIHQAARSAGLNTSTGICTGQIYYAANPTESSSSESILIGPTLNQAARLQNLARSGQILASASTYQQTRCAFEFQESTLHLPGEADHKETAIYQVIANLESPEKARGLDGLRARLVGRDAELSHLKDTLAGLLHGQGHVVALVGEAGLGKTRLVTELKQHAIQAWDAGNMLLWLESRCQEWRMSTSYWPFIDLFQNLLYYFAQEELDRSAALVALLEEMAERHDLEAESIANIGALLGNLLSLRFGNNWDERLKNASPEQVQRQTFQAIFSFLVALSRQQPLALIFEDLHWADDLSLDLLSQLLEAAPIAPILLICLYRSDHARQGQRLTTIAERKIPEHFTEIALRDLLPEQSLHLVRSLLGEDIPPPDGRYLADELFAHEFFLTRSWGNPFFVEEAIRALADQGVLFRQDGRWQIHITASTPSVPESVQSLILSRVDGLDASLKSVLRGASVLGRLFPASILAQIIPGYIDLPNALWRLEEAALIYRQRVNPEIEYAFKHALIQDVVYQTIASRQRAELHRLAAEALEHRQAAEMSEHRPVGETGVLSESSDEIEQLAYHYQRSPNIHKAIEYLLKAGEKSRRTYRNREAIAYFKQALELWGQTSTCPKPDEERNRLRWKLTALAGLGQIFHGMGKEVDAEKYLLQAIALGQAVELDTPALVRLYYWLGEVLHWQRRYGEQIHLGQVGLDLLAENQTESLEGALMNQIIAIGYLARGDDRSFQALTESTARFIQCLPYSEELRPAYVHIILSHYIDRRIEQASHWLEVLQTLAQNHHDLRALAEVYDYQWGYAFQSGDLRQALQNCRRALELYPQIGDTFRNWRCQRDMAWGYLMSGELDPAEQYATQALQVARDLHSPTFESESHLICGLVYLCRNEFQPAQYAFQIASQPHRPGDATWSEWMAQYCLGRVCLSLGEAHTAQKHFSTALERSIPHHPLLGWWFNRWPLLASLLSGLEIACTHTGDDFASLVQQSGNWERHVEQSPLAPRQWRLQAAQPAADENAAPFFEDSFQGSIRPGWQWNDPHGDCTCQIGSKDLKSGLTIASTNGGDLWHLNLSAPRLLRHLPPEADDFTVQTVILLTGDSNLPTLGGLLIWQDMENYLRLVWGLRGPGNLSFDGCQANRNVILGSSLLSIPSNNRTMPSRIHLRIERRKNTLRALSACDAPPQANASSLLSWYCVGQTTLPAGAALQVGLHGVGWIDRTIYPGAFLQGAQIYFERFQIYIHSNQPSGIPLK